MSIVRSEGIAKVWKENVFTDSSILAITDVLALHDITESYQKEVSRLRYQQKINFFALSVSRKLTLRAGGGMYLEFLVRTSYTKWADPKGQAYFQVIDAMETLQEVAMTNLGDQWLGNVGGYSLQEAHTFPSEISLLGEPCFNMQFNFTGFICSA